MKFEWNRRYTTIAIYTVIVFLICYFVYTVTSDWESTHKVVVDLLRTLSPFIYALCVAYFINPLVTTIEKHLFFKVTQLRFKRSLSILIAYTLFFSFVIILLSFIIPQLISSIQEIAKLPVLYMPYIEEVLNKGSITLFNTGYAVDLSLVSDYLNENILSTFSSVSGVLTDFAPILISYLTKLTSGLFNILLGFIIAIYLLLSKERSLTNTRKIIFALFSPKKAIMIINLSKESNLIFINFIIGKLIDSLIVGLICFISLLIFKFPYALLLSVIVGITNIIPYFGPFIGGFIGFGLLLFINPIQALWYLLFIFVLQQFDGNILGPKILGDSTGLTPFWVIFAIIFFGSFFGFVGMFLGVPVLAVIRNIFKREIEILYNRRMANL